jgi:hypothetical protein
MSNCVVGLKPKVYFGAPPPNGDSLKSKESVLKELGILFNKIYPCYGKIVK